MFNQSFRVHTIIWDHNLKILKNISPGIGPQCTGGFPSSHYRNFCCYELSQLLRQTGFTVIQVQIVAPCCVFCNWKLKCYPNKQVSNKKKTGNISSSFVQSCFDIFGEWLSQDYFFRKLYKTLNSPVLYIMNLVLVLIIAGILLPKESLSGRRPERRFRPRGRNAARIKPKGQWKKTSKTFKKEGLEKCLLWFQKLLRVIYLFQKFAGTLLPKESLSSKLILPSHYASETFKMWS